MQAPDHFVAKTQVGRAMLEGCSWREAVQAAGLQMSRATTYRLRQRMLARREDAMGAGFSVVFPLTLSAAGHTSQHAAGTAIATVAACGYVGFLVGPPVIGFAADVLSLRLALSVVVVLSLCAAGCARALGGDQHTQ